MIFKRILVAIAFCSYLFLITGCNNRSGMNSSSFLDYVNDNITSGQINSTAGTHQFPESRNSSDNFTSNQHSDSDVLSNIDAKTYTEQDWRAHPGDFKLIAFTFDDAPSYSGTRNNTTAMIDTMNKYNGSGTLFILGNNITEHGVALLEYAVKKGFELGNHTYSHRSVSTDDIGKKWTAEEHYEDFKRCQDLVYEMLGIQMKWFRPSGLHTNETVFQATEKLGLPVVTCSIGTSDWNSSTTKLDIKESVLLNAYDGGIVLMHGWASNTVAVLDEICEELYNDGYRFCTLSELFEFKGIPYDQIPRDRVIQGCS